MSKENRRLSLKVLVATGVLYLLLSLPLLAAALGISRPEESLFLDVRDIAGAPHPWIFLSWWKVGLVVALVVAYAVATVAWARPAIPKSISIVTLVLVSAAVVVVLHWPELSFGLRDPDRFPVGRLDSALIQAVLYFPGGATGRVVAAAMLQVVLVVGVIRLIPSRASRGERRPA